MGAGGGRMAHESSAVACTTARGWSRATDCPALTSISLTVPSSGSGHHVLHLHGLDRHQRLAGADRRRPGLTCTASTVPGMGLVSGPAPAAGPGRCGRWSRAAGSAPRRRRRGPARRRRRRSAPGVAPGRRPPTRRRRSPRRPSQARAGTGAAGPTRTVPVADAPASTTSPATSQLGARSPPGRPAASRPPRPTGPRTGPAGAASDPTSRAAAATHLGGRAGPVRSAAIRSTSPVSSRPATTSGWSHQPAEEPDVGGHAEHGGGGQGRGQPGQGRGPVGSPGDHLGQHGVVVGADDRARPQGRSRPGRAGRSVGLGQAPAPSRRRAGSRGRGPRRTPGPRPRGRARRRRPRRPTGSGSPAATRSCHSTRSSPSTASVTGCSTWRRVFISMKKNSSGRSADTMNSTVPAPTYPHARAAATAADPMAARVASSRSGRRGLLDDLLVAALQAALPLAQAERPGRGCRRRPAPRCGGVGPRSARRAGCRPRRRRSPPGGPRRWRRAGRPGRSTRRMPLPPPPADGLSSTGRPISRAAAASCSSVEAGFVAAGHDRHPGRRDGPFGVDLVAHQLDGLGRRSDEDEPGGRRSAGRTPAFSDRNP